jgi:hypothetical protein
MRFPLPAAPRVTVGQLQPLREALDGLEGLDTDQRAAVRHLTVSRSFEPTYRDDLEALVADLGTEALSAARVNG